MNVKVKICGVNTISSIKASKYADYIGLVFYPKSPRFVSTEQAIQLVKVNETNQKIVGLFVDSENDVIEYITEKLNLDYIQLHGRESVEKVSYLKRKLNVGIIKSIAIGSKNDLSKADEYKEICDMILFDSKPGLNSLPGGTGLKFDWSILKNFRYEKDWLLAGGLNLENLREALKISNAPIVDISSGLESKKGIKSNKKIENFLTLVNKIKNEE